MSFDLSQIAALLEKADESQLVDLSKEIKKEVKARKKSDKPTKDDEAPIVDHATIFTMTHKEYMEYADFMEWKVTSGECPIGIPHEVPVYLVELGLQKLTRPEIGTPRQNYTPDELLYQELKSYLAVKKIHWKHAIGGRVMKWICYYNRQVFTWESVVDMACTHSTPELSYRADFVAEVQKMHIEECTVRRTDGSIKKFNGEKEIKPFAPSKPISVKALETKTIHRADGSSYKITRYDVGGIVVPKYIRSGNEIDTKGKADKVKAKFAKKVESNS